MVEKYILYVLLLLINLVLQIDGFICPLSQSSGNTDCGYVGITQNECISKSCCWQPTTDHSSYCTYPQYISTTNYYNSTTNGIQIDGVFTEQEVNKFFGYFLLNININNTGAIAAAPDMHTPGGSYFYHWARDGALTMNTLQTYTNNTFSKQYSNNYANWINLIQHKSDPNNIDIRIEPKYEIPDGTAYTGGWCRPQNDGPGLQAIALINGPIALTNSEKIWPIVKYNLDYILNGYDDSTCDLWEEITSTDFFWNRVTMAKALSLGAKYAEKLFYKTDANNWLDLSNKIKSEIYSTHWNGYYYYESSNRPIDGAVIVGLNDGYDEIDNFLNPLSYEVASTVYYYNILFSQEYQINNYDQKIGGILYGRYPGDIYAGGNPWILTTASLSSLFYRISNLTKNKSIPDNIIAIWSKAFNVDKEIINKNISLFFKQQGDIVLNRIKYYIKDYDYHMYEQIDKNTGKQISAYDLTWSYAEVLNALNLRNKI